MSTRKQSEKFLNDVYKKVGVKYNMDYTDIKKVYEGLFKYYQEKMDKADLLNKEYTEEEFNEVWPSYKIPNVGRFYCDYKRYKSLKKHLAYIKNKSRHVENKENKTNVQSAADNNEQIC